MDALLSLNAACAVIDAYGFGDNTFVAILRTAKERGFIKNGYVSQRALDKVIKEFAL